MDEGAHFLCPLARQASLLNACSKLVSLLREQPDLKQHLINNATIIQTVNLLETQETQQKRDVLLAVLQLVNEVLLAGVSSIAPYHQLSARYLLQILSNNEDKRKNTIQTNFCLLGGIPAVTRFASPHYPKSLRMETATFINHVRHINSKTWCTVPDALMLSQICDSNPLVLHMFIACGGLQVLTTLLETNYNAFKALIHSTIKSIWNIFHIQVRLL